MFCRPSLFAKGCHGSRPCTRVDNVFNTSLNVARTHASHQVHLNAILDGRTKVIEEFEKNVACWYAADGEGKGKKRSEEMSEGKGHIFDRGKEMGEHCSHLSLRVRVCKQEKGVCFFLADGFTH